MVNLYVFNPSLKLRFLSGLVSKGSKRILSNIKAQPTATPSGHLAPPKFNLGVFDLIDTELRHVPQGGLTHDANYYTEERESGLCVFRLEDTLFKVCLSLQIWTSNLPNPTGPQMLPDARTMRLPRHV